MFTFFSLSLSTLLCVPRLPALPFFFPPLLPLLLLLPSLDIEVGVAEAPTLLLLRRSRKELELFIVGLQISGEINCHPGRAPYQGRGKGCPFGVHTPSAAPLAY